MPRGDRTGPSGFGPMTGRRAGYCAGNDVPGYVSTGGAGFGVGMGAGRGGFAGRGGGFGGRGGGGRGWRNMYYATGQPGWMRGPRMTPWSYGGDGAVEPSVPPVGAAPDEATALKAQAEYLGSVLEDVRKRLAELEAAADE